MERHRFYTTGLVVLLLAIIANTYIGLHDASRLRHDEQATRRQALRTRVIQQQGEPVGRCLLEALKAVSPLLLRVPAAERPLEAYVRLQSHRYLDARCPDGTAAP
jgi:hypothetical protein